MLAWVVLEVELQVEVKNRIITSSEMSQEAALFA